MRAAFGDTATCQTRLATQLQGQLQAPGTSTTIAQVQGCSAALPQVACSDLLGRVQVDACKTMPGPLATGSACGADGQCASTHCVIPSTATCGTCGELAAAGAACSVDTDCSPAMTCLNGACARYGGTGATCSATQPCRPDLACVGGSCGTPRALGAACASSSECNQLQGQFWNPQSLVCQTVTLATAGSACGLVAGGVTLCEGPGSLCRGDNAAPYQGTCVAFAADGASCATDGGPLCDYGAVCVAGRCQRPDPASCR